jgi:hypothetical protein
LLCEEVLEYKEDHKDDPSEHPPPSLVNDVSLSARKVSDGLLDSTSSNQSKTREIVIEYSDVLALEYCPLPI